MYRCCHSPSHSQFPCICPCMALLSRTPGILYMHYGNVSPVMLPLCSFMEHHKVAGDANTQSYANVRGTFMTIIWRETQIHRFMRMFEFNNRIWMWKCCGLMMLRYLNCRWNEVWMKVTQVQNISVWKYCKFSRSATETIINALISIQLNLNVIIPTFILLSFIALKQQL